MNEATTRKEATGKPARVPKHANGHAAAHAEAPAAEVNEAATEPVRAPAKAGKKGRIAKGAAAAPALEKIKRLKKEKVVRDSFTMPKTDYERIALLKQKCLDAGVAVKKSELLRAGLIMLDALPNKRLIASVSAVEMVKTGRPTNG